MGGFWVERRVRRASYWVRKALPTPPRPITATKMGVGVVMVGEWVVGGSEQLGGKDGICFEVVAG